MNGLNSRFHEGMEANLHMNEQDIRKIIYDNLELFQCMGLELIILKSGEEVYSINNGRIFMCDDHNAFEITSTTVTKICNQNKRRIFIRNACQSLLNGLKRLKQFLLRNIPFINR